MDSYEESGVLEGSGCRSHVMRNVVILLAFEWVASQQTTP